jgi:hypothetical protein
MHTCLLLYAHLCADSYGYELQSVIFFTCTLVCLVDNMTLYAAACTHAIALTVLSTYVYACTIATTPGSSESTPAVR